MRESKQMLSYELGSTEVSIDKINNAIIESDEDIARSKRTLSFLKKKVQVISSNKPRTSWRDLVW